MKNFNSFLVLVLNSFSFYNVLVYNRKYVQVHFNDLLYTCFFIKNHVNCQFKVIADIICVDYPNKKERFSLVYELLSVRFNVRYGIRVFLGEGNFIYTISPYFPVANWYEREVFDLFGIFFKGHEDLRRILTDYGFEGFPIRKDFPLSGYVEVFYDVSKNRVVCGTLELSQKFRSFSYKNTFSKKFNLVFKVN